MNVYNSLLGDSRWWLSDKQSWTQRPCHVVDSVYRAFRMLVTKRNCILSQLFGLPSRLWRLAVPPHRGPGVHQQLHQPFHLRRQVSQVPGWRQTSNVENQTGSTAAITDFCHRLT